MEKEKAFIYTAGFLHRVNGKTAHGLIRHSGKYTIAGVIDEVSAGRRGGEVLEAGEVVDAGEVLDGHKRDIPVYGSLGEALKSAGERPEYFILGVAVPGGYLPAEMKAVIYEALREKMKVINCLHELLCEDPKAVEIAEQYGGEIIDLRKPKPFGELHFYSGDILTVKAPRIAFLGTDCAMGKRTSAVMTAEALEKRGIKTEVVYTGQTGRLQGFEYGLILDATPNDFVCGELERQVVLCDREKKPDLILIEGQSSLRNPSGPCGSEILVSCKAEGTVLQHAPRRIFYESFDKYPWPIPSLAEEVRLVELYGSKVLAVSLYEEGMDRDGETERWKSHYREELGCPVAAPLSDGAEKLADLLQEFIEEQRER
ncbi:MAG: DUF1611 domain-containing protein [Spirochaetaceae bacterium]